VADPRTADHPTRNSFLKAGVRELARKIARFKLRRSITQLDLERAAALTALGQRAWQEKIDLAAFADLRDRLAGLDARTGELSETTGKLEQEKAALEQERRTELDNFAARRHALELKKNPVDAALRAARSNMSASEQTVTQAQSRLAAIAGKLAALERDIASLGAGSAPDQAQRLAAAQGERSRFTAEQSDLATRLAKATGELPAQVAEESRLAGESRNYAAEIAVIDAEQKAAIAHIDANLGRVRNESQGASKQATAVQKDRSDSLGNLGRALYDSKVGGPQLAEPVERVAGIDRARAQSQASLEASLAETRSLAGATMAKFWSVILGVPLALAVLGVGTYHFLNRDVPVTVEPQPVAQAKAGACEVQKPPDNGTGVGVRSDCLRTEGTFADGRLKNGKITYPDGRVREGAFVGGQQIGKGKLTWKDGRRYEGNFVDGRSWGPGVYVGADGTRDTGMFRPGAKLNGIGTRKSPDGSALVGEFVNGQPSRKMLRVKEGKAEVVELADQGVAAKSTAIVETSSQ
jgi:hypothetical protein